MAEDKGFQTAYAKAWEDFKQSADYNMVYKVMSGWFRQPYLDNMLRRAFDYGWNAERTGRLPDVRQYPITEEEATPDEV